jgi:tetratricopeptide (TPR) repeat protein
VFERRRILAVGVAVGLGAIVVFGLDQLTTASALTTSYTRALPTHESLVLDAYETLSGVGFFRATAARLTDGKRGDLERLTALQDWTTMNVRAQYAAPTRVVADNFYDIVRRGFGFCDQSAHVFASLARFAGYDSRLLFLRKEDGVSPHTVAQVSVEGHWVVVDAWLGVVWHTPDGRLLSVEDVVADVTLLDQYPYGRLWGLTPLDFDRGTPFYTFPYQSAVEFLQKVGAKLTRTPVAPPPSSVGLAPLEPAAASSTGTTPSSGAKPTTGTKRQTDELRADAILAFDRARRAQLDGRYIESVAAYRTALDLGLDAEMAAAAKFFTGLAYLEAEQPEAAVNAFKIALADTKTDWRSSSLLYLGRAYAAMGDFASARKSISESSVPTSADELMQLGSQP